MEECHTVVVTVTVGLVVEIGNLTPTGVMDTADHLKEATMKYVLNHIGVIVIILKFQDYYSVYYDYSDGQKNKDKTWHRVKQSGQHYLEVIITCCLCSKLILLFVLG